MPKQPSRTAEIAKIWRPTKHALDRMRERAITHKEVDAVLARPDVITPEKSGKTSYWRTVDGRRIRVYAVDADKNVEPDVDLVVITVAAPDEDENATRAKGD